jgi:hypothetical protein
LTVAGEEEVLGENRFSDLTMNWTQDFEVGRR